MNIIVVMRIHPFVSLVLPLVAFLLVPPARAACFETDFGDGKPRGWNAGFADYPVAQRPFYELKSGIRRMPPIPGVEGKGFFLSGNNHSDDLAMFITRRVRGLKPDTEYRVRFDVLFASNASSSAFGVGGSPGSSVFVKAGAARVRPVTRGPNAKLNIAKGNQARSGRDAMTLGTIGVKSEDGTYRLKRLANDGEPFRFRTNRRGEAWLFVATESGFEATTSIYIRRVTATFREVKPRTED